MWWFLQHDHPPANAQLHADRFDTGSEFRHAGGLGYFDPDLDSQERLHGQHQATVQQHYRRIAGSYL
jgi:hypothetical protein